MNKLKIYIIVVSYAVLFKSILDYTNGNIVEAVYPLLLMATLALINLAYKFKE